MQFLYIASIKDTFFLTCKLLLSQAGSLSSLGRPTDVFNAVSAEPEDPTPQSCVNSMHRTNCIPNIHLNVRFQVLTAANMMFRIVFWDVLPCKMFVDRRFRGAYCLHHQGWVSLERKDRGYKGVQWTGWPAYRLSPRLATQALDSYIPAILSR
jgi:hypothetical protein